MDSLCVLLYYLKCPLSWWSQPVTCSTVLGTHNCMGDHITRLTMDHGHMGYVNTQLQMFGNGFRNVFEGFFSSSSMVLLILTPCKSLAFFFGSRRWAFLQNCCNFFFVYIPCLATCLLTTELERALVLLCLQLLILYNLCLFLPCFVFEVSRLT